MRILKFTAVIFALTVMVVSVCFAESTDTMFQNAREKAFAGEWIEAKNICNEILSSCEDCHDARILLGRIFAWEKNYEAARPELNKVLEKKPDYDDARIALIDVELWDHNYEEALKQSEKGLSLSPGNKEFIFKKSLALERLGKFSEAESAANELMSVEPSHSEGGRLHTRVRRKTADQSISFSYSLESFSDPTSTWKVVETEWGRKFDAGSLYLRFTLADRFKQMAQQYEIDLYPKIAKGTYAYLNAGFSGDRIFPTSRIGGEIYHNFPKGYEASLGMRYLNFSSNTRLYTASISKYIGDYWISFRPYYSNKNDAGNLSENLTVRKYYGDRGKFISFSLGAGSSAYETITAQDDSRLDSLKFGIDRQWEIGSLTYLKLLFGYENEEYLPGKDRDKYKLDISVKHHY